MIESTQFNCLNYPVERKKEVCASILKLPEETLYQIFSYLSLLDFQSITKTCRQWNRITNDEHLWKLFCHILFPQIKEFPSSYKNAVITSKNWKKGICKTYKFKYKSNLDMYDKKICGFYYTFSNQLVLINQAGLDLWDIYKKRKIAALELYGSPFQYWDHAYYEDRVAVIADYIKGNTLKVILFFNSNKHMHVFEITDCYSGKYSVFFKHHYLVILRKKFNLYHILHIPPKDSRISLTEAQKVNGFAHSVQGRELWIYQTNHQIAVFNFFKNQITDFIKLNGGPALLDLAVMGNYILQLTPSSLTGYLLNSFTNSEGKLERRVTQIWKIPLSIEMKLFPAIGGSTLFALREAHIQKGPSIEIRIYDAKDGSPIVTQYISDIHPDHKNLIALDHSTFQYINREKELIFYDFRPQNKNSCSII